MNMKTFIIDNIQDMSLDTLCLEVSRHIHQKHGEINTESDDPDTGYSPQQLEQHMRQHMLHPSVKMAIQIRDLCLINHVSMKNMFDGEIGIDKDMANIFMSSNRQLQTIYKSGDVDKLMFATGVNDLPDLDSSSVSTAP